MIARSMNSYVQSAEAKYSFKAVTSLLHKFFKGILFSNSTGLLLQTFAVSFIGGLNNLFDISQYLATWLVVSEEMMNSFQRPTAAS